MKFEVFIPSRDPDGFDVTLIVEAANWMKALRLGLARTTGEDAPVHNVLCDIKDDNVIHVTDLESRRVFKLRERVGEPEVSLASPDRATKPETFTAKQVAQIGASLNAAQDSPSAVVASSTALPTVKATGKPLGITAEGSGVFRTIGTREIQKLSQAEAGAVLQETTQRTADRLEAIDVGRSLSEEDMRVADNALEAVFLEISDLFEGNRTMEEAVAFCLDLVMRNIPAESGAVVFADESGANLYFAAARGPKATSLLDGDFQVPIDKGIVGFCTRSGVSLAISDASSDPRFFSEVSESLGYQTKSVACAPIQCDGMAYGAIELLNYKGQSGFAPSDANVLSYVGKQCGRFIQRMLG
ncbi:MAG: GAF domain-containing protein [Myxococcales bacterium]|nr:GAF domain-containing protein [Myxococcales bacterium]